MMNKRRTSEIGKAKYLLFAPLAGVLLVRLASRFQ